MNTVTIVLLIILAVLTIAVVTLYFLGKRAQKKQEEQQAQIDAMKQTASPGGNRPDAQMAARLQAPRCQGQGRSPNHDPNL